MFPDRHIPACVRLSTIMDYVANQTGGFPKGTVVSEKDMQSTIMTYIRDLKNEIRNKSERLCRCCRKPESMWIQNEDIEHLYPKSADICQACYEITRWANEIPECLEAVAAYCRLLEKEKLLDE